MFHLSATISPVWVPRIDAKLCTKLLFLRKLSSNDSHSHVTKDDGTKNFFFLI